ncbi:MAG: DUF2275 domain-containing protein [Nitrospirae bacterium]|nr:DUF2275 domain-containing protein [Nitrospirota bacterium]
MECKDIQERLSAYIDGVTSSEEKTLIDKHLRSCQRCSKSFLELKKTLKHLKRLEEAEPPSWLAQKIMAKIKKEAEPKKGILQRLFYPLHIKLPIEAIATIFIAVTAVYLYKAIEPQKKSAQAPTEEITALTQLQEKDMTQKRAEVDKAGQKGDLKKRDEREFEKEKPAPAKESIDKTDRYKEAPAAPAEIAKKEKAIKPAGVSVKEETRQRVAATEPELKKTLADKKEDVINITISVKNIETSSKEIEKIVIQLKGRIIKKEPSENKKLLTAEIDAKKIKELRERLKTIGKTKEKLGALEKDEEIVEIRIEIVRE